MSENSKIYNALIELYLVVIIYSDDGVHNLNAEWLNDQRKKIVDEKLNSIELIYLVKNKVD